MLQQTLTRFPSVVIVLVCLLNISAAEHRGDYFLQDENDTVTISTGDLDKAYQESDPNPVWVFRTGQDSRIRFRFQRINIPWYYSSFYYFDDEYFEIGDGIEGESTSLFHFGDNHLPNRVQTVCNSAWLSVSFGMFYSNRPEIEIKVESEIVTSTTLLDSRDPEIKADTHSPSIPWEDIVTGHHITENHGSRFKDISGESWVSNPADVIMIIIVSSTSLILLTISLLWLYRKSRRDQFTRLRTRKYRGYPTKSLILQAKLGTLSSSKTQSHDAKAQRYNWKFSTLNDNIYV